MTTTRRELAVLGGTLAAGMALTTPAHARLLPQVRGMGRGRFLDGVASGEPGPNAVTFWGRVRTSRPRSAARLLVASDPGMSGVVADVLVPTSSGVDHTLKTRVGGLEPGRHYWYAWQTTDDVSPIGRTKTAPAPDSTDAVTVGYSSCQNLPAGFFNAHHEAATTALDVYAFMGDYTYERDGGGTPANAARGVPDPPSADLTSYRNKLRLYRTDPGLRELHRVHPVVHTWDDHEVSNDYTAGRPTPLQRNAAYRANFEWLPRIAFPGDRFRIYRSLKFGAHLEMFVIDARQYRTPGFPGETLLGRPQMDWLKAGLASSTSRWKLVGNPDMIAPLGLILSGEDGVTINPDQWDGYPTERTELLSHIASGRIDDVVFLTGDIHMYMANHMLLGGRSVATEYIGGSVTSSGIPDMLNGIAVPAIQAVNGHIRYLEGAEHGWSVARATRDELRVEYRVSDIRRDRAPMRRLAAFVQATGANELRRDDTAKATVGSVRTLGQDPVDAPATPGTALYRRRARVERMEDRDLQRRLEIAEKQVSPAGRRALRQDQRNRTRKTT